MYHICPAQCQIQLLGRKVGNRQDIAGFLGEAPMQRSIKLADAVAGGLFRMQHREDLRAADRGLDLRETRDHLSGLAHDRERIERGALEQAIGLRDQIRAGTNVLP